MSRSYDKTNWRNSKIKTLRQAVSWADWHRMHKHTIVSVNGSFDILHAGHLDQLEEAKRQGTALFVGVNSDASVREGKGRGRPYIPEQLRAAMLAALACTDYIIIIDAPYDGGVPKALINAVRPHIHVNGADYGSPETWVEWSAMQEHGTRGYVVQHRNPLSTTTLISKIRSARPKG